MVEKLAETWAVGTYGICLGFWCVGVCFSFVCFCMCVYFCFCLLVFFLNQWELYLEVQLQEQLMCLFSHFKSKQQGEEVCMG